jgi:endonuclease YncB( thermonuclease family)
MRVIAIADGDTLTVLTLEKAQLKIRLAGIDAPESGQSFGNRSKQTLSDCAFGKQATLEGDKIDRFGRTVAKVVVAGVDCNLRQIELGMAPALQKVRDLTVASRSYRVRRRRGRGTLRKTWPVG